MINLTEKIRGDVWDRIMISMDNLTSVQTRCIICTNIDHQVHNIVDRQTLFYVRLTLIELTR